MWFRYVSLSKGALRTWFVACSSKKTTCVSCARGKTNTSMKDLRKCRPADARAKPSKKATIALEIIYIYVGRVKEEG